MVQIFTKMPLVLYFISHIICERLLPSLLQVEWDFSLEQSRRWKMVCFVVGFMECL